MAHQRSVILDEISTRLSALASAPPVFPARVLAIQSAPAVAYEATDDQVTDTYKTDTEYMEQIRSLTVAITVVATSPSTRDEIALEVEKGMAPDFGIESSLNSTSLEANGEGDQQLYGCQLFYEFKYSVREDAPDVAT